MKQSEDRTQKHWETLLKFTHVESHRDAHEVSAMELPALGVANLKITLARKFTLSTSKRHFIPYIISMAQGTKSLRRPHNWFLAFAR